MDARHGVRQLPLGYLAVARLAVLTVGVLPPPECLVAFAQRLDDGRFVGASLGQFAPDRPQTGAAIMRVDTVPYATIDIERRLSVYAQNRLAWHADVSCLRSPLDLQPEKFQPPRRWSVELDVRDHAWSQAYCAPL